METRELKPEHVHQNVGLAASVGDDSGLVLAAHVRHSFDLVVRDSLFQFLYKKNLIVFGKYVFEVNP